MSNHVALGDQAAHYVMLRFDFGTNDADVVSVWWDPMQASFSPASPTASLSVSNASFSRVTLGSSSADTMDELRIRTGR